MHESLPRSRRHFWIVVAIFAVVVLLCVPMVWLAWRLLAPPLPQVDYTAAHLAIIEQGQPTESDAPNGYTEFRELCDLLRQRGEEIEAREKAAWEANIANSDMTWGSDRFDWWADLAIPTDDPICIHLAQVAAQELARLEAEGFFERVLGLAHHNRFVGLPEQGMAANLAPKLHDYSTERRLIHLVANRLTQAIQNNDASSAARHFAAGMAIARCQEQQSTLMAYLVGIASGARMLGALKESLMAHSLSDDVARALLGECDASPSRDAMLKAINGERVLVLDSIQSIYHGAIPGLEHVGLLKLRYTHAGAVALINQVFDAHTRLVTLARFEREQTADESSAMESVEAHVLLEMLVSAIHATAGVGDKYDFEMASTKTMLALELHRARHGAYPESLDALVPSILTELPTDPYAPDGQFRYRPIDAKAATAPEAYLLYSVGFDAIDNNANPAQSTGYQALSGEAPGTDFVICPASAPSD